MNKILPRVIDPLRLKIQLQHHLDDLHDEGKRIILLPAPFGDDRARLCDQFIEHDVILLELLVELLVIFLVADMDGAHQVNGQISLPFRRAVADDSGFEGDRLLLLIPLQADELGRCRFLDGGLFCRRRRLRQQCGSKCK